MTLARDLNLAICFVGVTDNGSNQAVGSCGRLFIGQADTAVIRHFITFAVVDNEKKKKQNIV
jgi:hypothetical protein